MTVSPQTLEMDRHSRLYFRNEPKMDLSRMPGDSLILMDVEKMKSAGWIYHHIVMAIDRLFNRLSNKHILDEPVVITGK